MEKQQLALGLNFSRQRETMGVFLDVSGGECDVSQRDNVKQRISWKGQHLPLYLPEFIFPVQTVHRAPRSQTKTSIHSFAGYNAEGANSLKLSSGELGNNTKNNSMKVPCQMQGSFCQ